MRSAATDFAPLRFSTNDHPARDRLPFWREFFARKIVLVDVEPQVDLPLDADATLFIWPGLRVVWLNVSTPTCYSRTPAMAAEGDDSFALLLKQSGLVNVSQRGRDVSLESGEAVGLLHTEPASVMTSRAKHLGLKIPPAALAPLVGDVESAVMRPIPRNNEALQLLMKYLEILGQDPALMTTELRHVAVTHIHDLIAMAIGATRDGAAIANGRGVRAARLKAVKADILENLGTLELTVGAVALRQRVAPRYVHRLFETEGVTFSEFVLAQRLTRTHRMLSDPRFSDLSVSAIAFAAGFGDLSYFNRTFRRRFGTTPSELRHAAHPTSEKLTLAGA